MKATELSTLPTLSKWFRERRNRVLRDLIRSLQRPGQPIRILDLGGCPLLQDALLLGKCPSLREVNIGTARNKRGGFRGLFHRPTKTAEEIDELSRRCPTMQVHTEDLPGKAGRHRCAKRNTAL